MASNIDPWGNQMDNQAANRPGSVHAYWIHERVKAKTSVTGYYYLPDCVCSNCGFYSRRELAVCRSCNAIMDAAAPRK